MTEMPRNMINQRGYWLTKGGAGFRRHPLSECRLSSDDNWAPSKRCKMAFTPVTASEDICEF